MPLTTPRQHRPTRPASPMQRCQHELAGAMLAVSLVFLLAACGGGGAASVITLPAVPANLAAAPSSSSSIELTWNAVAGATSYDVYRGSDANPTATRVATVSGTNYRDTGLFAGSNFHYQILANNSAGSSALTAVVSVATQAFTSNDQQVGDPTVSYANVEFTADGRYMVWFELDPNFTDGRGSVWHCAVDPDSGDLNPSDGKGYRAFDSFLWGRANAGQDASGVYYVGMDRSGQLIQVRPSAAATGSATTLATPPDNKRRAVYPSILPGSGKRYVLWILNDAAPGDGYTGASSANTAFTLQVVDLDDPAMVTDIETQPKPGGGGYAPMDAAFVRWYRGAALIDYGSLNTTSGRVELRTYDPGSGQYAFATDDASVKIDPYPLVFAASEVILAGKDASTTSNVFTRPADSTGLYSVSETITPSGSLLSDPILAQSHEPITFESLLYSAYQINERGATFLETITNTGEIWLSTVLQATARQWRVSADNPLAKAEPETLVGTARVWVFYTAAPAGSNLTTATWQLRRADTPIGKL